MPPPLMGSSPASSHLRPSSLSASSPISLSDWLLTSSDRDTHILTQALTRELSTPAPSSSRSNTSESLHVLRALQQQQKQQHQQQTQAAAAVAMSSGWAPRHDGLHNPLQLGSPPSSNSHSPLSASNPGSPYSNSTITTRNSSMSVASGSLLAHINPNTSLQQDVQEGPFASTMVSHNASPARAAPIALSSQASMGAGANKVSKRRSRASNRIPIAVLSADVSNFRAMVQQLTGIPSTPSMHSYGGSSLLKPYPTKHPYTTSASLPTLDTSASFLGPKFPTKDPLQGFSFAQKNRYISSGPSRQGGDAESMSRAPPYVKQAVFGERPSVSSSSTTLSSIWNHASYGRTSPSVIESQPFLSKQAPTTLEEHLPTKSQYSAVDSWLSFDGVLANQTPNIEIARMA